MIDFLAFRHCLSAIRAAALPPRVPATISAGLPVALLGKLVQAASAVVQLARPHVELPAALRRRSVLTDPAQPGARRASPARSVAPTPVLPVVRTASLRVMCVARAVVRARHIGLFAAQP